MTLFFVRKLKRIYNNFLFKKYSKTTLFINFVILVCVLLIISKQLLWTREVPSVDYILLDRDDESSFFEAIKSSKIRSDEKVDWHDYKYFEKERQMRGPGEQGRPYNLNDESDIQLNAELVKQNGYYAVASDHISVNRSIKDIRHKDCQKKLYLKNLPSVSVVIPFYNDHLSTLMRSVHSIMNRSPPHLVKEVILVNDFSTKKFLYDDLKKYLKEHFERKARVIDLEERSGLIKARLAGAKIAQGDVLVFLDSHIEVNFNWLPPLLEPIAKDYKVCTCPYIDVIDWKTFEYRAQDEGARGIFDWNFLYKRIPIRPGDQESPSDPFPSPVMAGGLFAISSKFFWELGGYDSGLDIWGGEQYELSFKIWLCGGQMFDIPCSRIGHVYRHSPFPNPRNGQDYVTKNFKRVVEVWMDEFKEHIYKRNPRRYNDVDPGDLTEQFRIKNSLQCKPFRYFVEEVAPDMYARFPYDELIFASGAVESLGDVPNLCIDTLGRGVGQQVGLYSCASNKTFPHSTQFFSLGFFRDIRKHFDSGICFDTGRPKANHVSMIYTAGCHWSQGRQYFRYDLGSQTIRYGKDEKFCLEANGNEKTVYVSSCKKNFQNQKWKFGYHNVHALENWKKVGAKIQ